MNEQHETTLGLARVHAEDAQYEIRHGRGWLATIFCAITRAGQLEEARDLAEIGHYLAERSAGIADSELEELRRELATLSEVAA